jgi:serine/threonine-protein kinase
MATVWVARLLGKHGFEKIVAVKTILTRLASVPHFQRMFLDEARIASRIHHPNVAQILDLGDHHGVLFLVMEWVDGDALSKLARALRDKGQTFPSSIALRIMSDVCAGLHAAHDLRGRNGAPLGIVHRDVSPQNILIRDQGIAKIIDFGIAKAHDRSAGDTETGSFRGKVNYMAPEQALFPRTTDRRADVWAAGAVLYLLVSGRAPYEGESDVATLARLGSGKPPSPLPPDIPEPLRTLIARAIAWNVEERYQSADDLRVAIENAMREMRIASTSAEVASFSALHLAERAAARRKAVELALSEAEERSGAYSSEHLRAASRSSATTALKWVIAVTLLVLLAIPVGILSSAAHRGSNMPATAPVSVQPQASNSPPLASTASPVPPVILPTPSVAAVSASSTPLPPAMSRRPATHSPSVNQMSPAATPTTKHRMDYGF